MFANIKQLWKNLPIPEPYVGPLAVGVIVHAFLPWRLFSTGWIGHGVGWPLIVTGVFLAGWAVRETVDIDIAKPTRIVTTGPYAFSRNPMYLGWTLMYLGIALVVNTAWLLVFLPAALLVTHVVVVRHEEHILEQHFDEDYRRYKRRVRRYL